MNDQHPRRQWWKWFPAAAMLLCILLFLWKGRSLSWQTLYDAMPKKPWQAALVFWGCYAAKSLSVFFPLLVLYAAAGRVFPLPRALLVNLIGLVICESILSGSKAAGEVSKAAGAGNAASAGQLSAGCFDESGGRRARRSGEPLFRRGQAALFPVSLGKPCRPAAYDGSRYPAGKGAGRSHVPGAAGRIGDQRSDCDTVSASLPEDPEKNSESQGAIE